MINNDLSIVLITLNEAHNLERFFKSINGWVRNIFVIDSYSSDSTIDICLKFGAKVYQRRFDNFGNQWNAAIKIPEIKTKWVMKLDPDEIVTENLKKNINSKLRNSEDGTDGFYLTRKLFFFNKMLPVEQKHLRIWRNGKCLFTNSLVNEHATVIGETSSIKGYFEHHDSPNLEHWFSKQNKYTTAEATSFVKEMELAIKPNIFGNSTERRMLIKKYFFRFPFRYIILFLYHYLFLRSFISGKEGYYWSKLRTNVYQMIEYKIYEMKKSKISSYPITQNSIGSKDNRCIQIQD